jgi:hypothetical protein
MSQAIELAKQGDTKAIAALMGKHLMPQGIAVQVASQAETLQVLLDGIDVPNQAQMTNFVSNGIQKLEIEQINQLQIFGRQSGQNQSAWTSAFARGESGWDAIELSEPVEFGEGNLKLLAQQGDVKAIEQFVNSAVQDLASQMTREADMEPAAIAAFVELDAAGLLTTTVETTQFLDGPAFAADLGYRLNEIASKQVKEVALYKRKNATAQPFLIKQMTLAQSR